MPLIYLCVCLCLCAFVRYLAHYNKCSVIRTAERALFTHIYSTFAYQKIYVYSCIMRDNKCCTFIHIESLLSSRFFFTVVRIYFHLVLTYVHVCVNIHTYYGTNQNSSKKCIRRIYDENFFCWIFLHVNFTALDCCFFCCCCWPIEESNVNDLSFYFSRFFHRTFNQFVSLAVVATVFFISFFFSLFVFL